MRTLARVVAAEALGELRLRVTFSDGVVRELDFDAALTGDAYQELREPAQFERVMVDPTAGTVAWPNGIDFDPDVLHGAYPPANGHAPSVIREYHLRATG